MNFVTSYLQLRRTVVGIAILLISLCGAVCAAQSSNPAADELSQALEKYPGLLPEFGHLAERLEQELKFPAPRAESRLLPMLPESTVVYAAFPNYGDVSHQALQIFHEELQQSAVLRDWWQHADPATAAKVEEFLQKFYEVSQYLGDEIAISGSMSGGQPSLLLVAEVRKPGLKIALQQTVKELGGETAPGLRVLDSEELANAKDRLGDPVVLVRPGFLVAGINLISVRELSARIDRSSREFIATPFGKRLMQTYDGGATTVGAVDLHTILGQVPPEVRQNQPALDRTGFTDAKYLVWEHKTIAGKEVSQGELTFIGPRRGIAAWLAKAAPLGNLDFVSPKSILTASVALSDPARIYDDVREIATATKPDAFAMVDQMEQMLGLSVRNDVLGQLGGEITIEVDSVTPPAPTWKLLLSVKDRDRFQQTLNTLMGLAHMQPEPSTEGGRTYYSITVPTPARPMEVAYTFADGYLLIGSGREAVAGAIHLRESGESLGKSKTFLASLPPGHPSGLSGLFYEDPAALMALKMGQMAPGSAGLFSSLAGQGSPLVICAYGEDNAIREATTSVAFDPAFVMIGAAVAIPNLLRARTAANEAAAVGALRAINVAQVTYSATYPQRLYARDLAALGPDPSATSAVSAEHASLIDTDLGNPSCTGTNWCVKSGFRFRVTGSCTQRKCREFVAIATPITSNTGGKNFCSTSDGVIHAKPGPPMLTSVTASQCRAWPPLQ